jgi:predicted DNA-binding transcriptional regulator AlpA
MATTTSTTAGNESPRYLDEAEVAALLSLSPATLRTWRCLGRGPKFAKVGRSVRYRPADVHGWVAKQIRG